MANYAKTSATLGGARDLNRQLGRIGSQEDIGYKLERVVSAVCVLQSAISAINTLNTAVCAINNALGSAAASMAGASLFSAWSGYGSTASAAAQTAANITAYSNVSNFSSS